MSGALARAFRRSPYDTDILKLAVPALGALAADPLVSLVDTAFVGRLGVEALGALAISAAIFGVAFTVFNFLSYATTPFVAIRLGSGDHEGAGRLASTAVVAALVLGVVSAVVVASIAPSLLSAMGAGPELIEPGTEYLRIRAWALPALLLITAGHGIFRGAQDTATPLRVAAGLNVVNLILDPLLIFAAGWGLAGAAWATVIAQWAGALGFVLMYRLRRHTMGLPLGRPQLSDVRILATAARAIIIRSAGLLLIFTSTTSVAARLGTAQVAAHQIALQIFLFLSLALDAIAIAAQAMLGKAVGEGDATRLRRQADRLVGMGTLAGVAIALVVAGLSPWIAGWFTDDAQVVDQFRTVALQLAVIQALGGAVFAWDGIVLGVTDFRFAMIASAGPAVIATLTLLLVIPAGWPLAAVWWIVVLLMALRAASLAWWHHYRLVIPS